MQHVCGCGTEAVFAFFVEIHRRGINGDKGGGQLHLAGVAEIFGGGLFGGEFVRAHRLPQQLGVDLRGLGLGGGQKFGHIAVELDKRVGGFDFDALAVLRVGLVGAVVFLHDGGGFEVAALFVKQVHVGCLRCG